MSDKNANNQKSEIQVIGEGLIAEIKNLKTDNSQLLNTEFKIFTEQPFGDDLEEQVRAFIEEEKITDFDISIASGNKVTVLLQWK